MEKHTNTDTAHRPMSEDQKETWNQLIDMLTETKEKFDAITAVVEEMLQGLERGSDKHEIDPLILWLLMSVMKEAEFDLDWGEGVPEYDEYVEKRWDQFRQFTDQVGNTPVTSSLLKDVSKWSIYFSRLTKIIWDERATTAE